MRRALAIVMALSGLAAACGSGAPSGAVGNAITAAGVARDTAGAGSARVETRTTPPPDPEVATASSVVTSGEIDFRAGTGELRSQLSVGGSTEIRWIGGHSYMKIAAPSDTGRGPLPTTILGKWIRIDDPNATDFFATFFRPDFLLEVLRSSSRDGRTLGHDTIRGVDTTRVRYVVDVRAMTKKLERSGLTPDTPKQKTAPVDVWVDARGRLRRFSAPELDEPTRTDQIDFYDFGVHVDVQAPPASEISDPQTVASSAASTVLAPADVTGTWKKVAGGTWNGLRWTIWQAGGDHGTVCSSFEVGSIGHRLTALPGGRDNANHDGHPATCVGGPGADQVEFFGAGNVDPGGAWLAGFAGGDVRELRVVADRGAPQRIVPDARTHTFAFFGERATGTFTCPNPDHTAPQCHGTP
jgi:hypothetical protein